jgi:PAS domain S-box-containing protein
LSEVRSSAAPKLESTGVTLVNTVTMLLAARPGCAGVEAALEALAAQGIVAAVTCEGHLHGVSSIGREIPLEAGGERVGTLTIADAELGDSLAPALALAIAHAKQARATAMLEALVESAPEGILLYAEGQIVSANAAARRLLGLTELPTAASIFEPRTLEGEPYQLGRSDGPASGQFHVRSMVNGIEHVFTGSFAPVQPVDGAGSPGSVVLVREVGENQERELLTQRFLERLVAALPTAVMICEPKTFRVVSANRAMLDLVGHEESELVGAEPPYPWWAEPPVNPVEDWLPDSAERWEQLYRRSDGTLVPVEGLTFTLHGTDGAPERLIALVTDLSERRRFEQQLVQSSKLASIGELAAGVAHEINNPLFAILGLVEFLLKDAEPGTKANERLLLVQQTGLEIRDIVRALLDFARERSDEFAPVPLELVVRQTLDLVRKTSAKKGIEIVERYADEDLTVNASANQLKQVVLNLVTNAQHALPDGGRIIVEVARDGDGTTASVTDNGPGIPADALESIFDPFFTTKRDIGGTGLGLSVSLGIAQMHGGDLDLVSEEGQGASFTLRLPLAS